MPKRAKVDAVTKAVALLSSRERSQAQLEAALRQRGYAEDELGAAIERVKALGYLDDGRVAANRARAGLSEGRSQADVVRRLAAQGLEKVAEAAVDEEARARGHDDEAAARALVLTRRLEGAKAARLLASRGFDEDVIRRVVDLGD